MKIASELATEFTLTKRFRFDAKPYKPMPAMPLDPGVFEHIFFNLPRLLRNGFLNNRRSAVASCFPVIGLPYGMLGKSIGAAVDSLTINSRFDLALNGIDRSVLAMDTNGLPQNFRSHRSQAFHVLPHAG